MYRTIVAVRKHIIPQEALACAAVGVRIEETLNNGVVVAGLEVIESGFLIRVVAVGAKKVEISEPLEE